MDNPSRQPANGSPFDEQMSLGQVPLRDNAPRKFLSNFRGAYRFVKFIFF